MRHRAERQKTHPGISRIYLSAFVTSQVDRYNNLLVGAPKYLLDCSFWARSFWARSFWARRLMRYYAPFALKLGSIKRISVLTKFRNANGHHQRLLQPLPSPPKLVAL